MTDLEAVFLSIIAQLQPCHGLAVGTEAEALLHRRVGVGSLYKALHRMESRGLLEAYWETRDVEESHRGPRRRYYKITSHGALELAAYQTRFARAHKLDLRPAQ
ncbi:MAG: helix-turn-helix transcriptional regulator [Dehalococcoidia bacterium]